MVFIRPTILRSAEDARAMTERRYGYIRDMQHSQNPRREPSIDELVREYMGAVPPAPPPAPPPYDPGLYPAAPRPGDQIIAPTQANPETPR
jgi:general secretion pathway protein D